MENIRIKSFYILLVLLFGPIAIYAKHIEGRVIDYISKKPIENVSVINIYTEMGIATDSTGKFSITVQKGELVEFRKIGYKIARVRIESDQVASFYNIELREGAIELDEVFVYDNKAPDWKYDSIRNRSTYKSALEFYKLEGLDLIQHPFDALSKRNRQIWAFQKNYEYWEQQKFIDYVFNERLIVQLTHLASDSLYHYMQNYRPSYNQIRTWNEYEFYEYIKYSVKEFRRNYQRRE